MHKTSLTRSWAWINLLPWKPEAVERKFHSLVNMLKFVFIAAFLFHATTSGLHQLQESWLDDIDGPKFLRGAKEEIQDESEELDTINDFPNDFKRVAQDDVMTATSIICDVAAAPEGTNTTKWNTNMITKPTGHACENPYPTVVELDWPDKSALLIPSMVPLHRCVGECLGKHKLQNCTVKEQEEVVLQVKEMINGKIFDRNIKVYNHTKCECACRIRSSDCNKTIHEYDDKQCACKCNKTLINSCNTKIQSLHPKTCACECNSAPKHCDTYNKNEEWNAKICACDCKEKIKNRCNRKGKVLNKSKCECECPTPLKTCPSGTSFLKYNCTCVDTSVNVK